MNPVPNQYPRKNTKKDRKRDGEKAHKPRYCVDGPYPFYGGPFPIQGGPYEPIPPQGFPPDLFSPEGFPFPPCTEINHNPKPKRNSEKAHKPRYRVYGPYPLPSGPFPIQGGPFGPIPPQGCPPGFFGPQGCPFPPFTDINHNPKPKRNSEKAHKPRYRVYGPYPLPSGPFPIQGGPFGPIPPQGCPPGFFGPQVCPFPPFTNINHQPKCDDENPFQPPFFFSGYYPIPGYPVPMQNSSFGPIPPSSFSPVDQPIKKPKKPHPTPAQDTQTNEFPYDFNPFFMPANDRVVYQHPDNNLPPHLLKHLNIYHHNVS